MPVHGGFIVSLEGMRCLAVMVVLLFHLDVPGFDGGYLGVDLFFVISGFIITGNILSDLQKNIFSPAEFYRRRFRRLFPALLVTVLVTLLAAIAVVPPAELKATAESAIYALFSVSNVNFWMGAGYFDTAAETKPLLHTWSLSVEEQFYLLWPAVLMLLAGARQRLALVTLLLLIASFAATLLWLHEIPNAIFYLLPFRVHQLMGGALVAILALNLNGRIGGFSAVLGVLGFLLLVVLGGENVSPAAGALGLTFLGLLMLLGRETPLAVMLLGNRVMHWVGKRSYAIYLVHWPMIVLFQFGTDFDLNVGDRLILFFASLLAAVALHHLVENPFRKRAQDKTRAQRMAMPASLLVLLLTVLVSGALWYLDGLPGRVDPRIQQLADSVEAEIKQRRNAIRFGSCNLHKVHTFARYNDKKCSTPNPNRKNMVVIGDSIGADTYMLLAQAYPDWEVSQATAGACTGLLEVNHTAGQYAACQELNAHRFSEVVERDFDLVVLASVWTEERIEPLAETVAYLQSRGKKVLVIGPRATFRGSVPLLISQQASVSRINVSLRERIIRREALLERLQESMPNVDIVDMGSVQCTPACDVVEQGHLLYYDSMHFTETGARVFGKRFRALYDLPALIEQ